MVENLNKSNTSNPTVSVVIATYRRIESLKAAIASVTSQSYQNIEIIVVDDNACPEWNQKVEAVIKEFENIIYIQNSENQGSANTRNIGISASKGEYITFLDDDDLYLPEKIYHQLKYMIDETADFSITDLFLYNKNNKIVDKRIRNYIKDNSPDSLLKYHLVYHLTGTDTMMFRRDYLIKIGGFPPIDIGDEFYLMKEAICANGKFSYAPGCNVKAYVHYDNAGLSSGQAKIDGENQLFKYKKRFFSQLDKKTIRHIKMRHHAVLAFAELKQKNVPSFFIQSIYSFISEPFQCLKLFFRRKD